LFPLGVAVFDVPSRRYVQSFKLSGPPGTMMRVGETQVVSFYGHPKLISLVTGEVLRAWEGLETGTQTSSICQNVSPSLRPLALDPERRRFAVASEDAIHVVTIDEGA
jgi:hypothetical protein